MKIYQAENKMGQDSPMPINIYLKSRLDIESLTNLKEFKFSLDGYINPRLMKLFFFFGNKSTEGGWVVYVTLVNLSQDFFSLSDASDLYIRV